MKRQGVNGEFPETPSFIHEMIVAEVDKQVHKKGETVSMADHKKRSYKSFTRAAAGVVIACVATTTVAFAAVNAFQFYTEKQGKYSVNVGMKADGDVAAIPEQISEVKVKASYIPDGMAWIDEDHLQNKNTPAQGGFSFVSMLMDQDDLQTVQNEKNVKESEEMTFGEHQGVYLTYNTVVEYDGNLTSRAYILFPEEYRVLEVVIGNDVSKEEAIKVLSGITLEETGKTVDSSSIYTWSERVNPTNADKGNGSTGDAEPVDEMKHYTSVSEDKLSVHKIGEDFALDMSGETPKGTYDWTTDITAKVDAVQVADDLSLLKDADLPDGWADAAGADGKLVQNELSYIKNGDGKDTLDEVVKKEKVNQKLVVVDVTCTNTGKEEWKHLCYNGWLGFMKQEKGKYEFDTSGYTGFGEEKTIDGQKYDQIFGSSVARPMEMAYFSAKEDEGNGGNYISLKAGESKQVRMAWIVNEQDLSNLCLDLNQSMDVEGLTDSSKPGVVDIRQ